MMKALVRLWPAVFCVLIANAGTKDTPSVYSQSYAILIKGVVAGNETVAEKRDANGDVISTSEHEMFISDGLETKRMAFSTRMVLSKSTGIPSSYGYWYTSGSSGDSYEVSIKDSQITRVLTRGGQSSTATVPLEPNMVFVDHNVYHQYDYLIRKYDARKGGRQTFANFLPLIGNDIPVALTYLGDSKLETSLGNIPVRNFRTEFVGILSGTLSVDKDGRLVRLLIPAQDLEVIRRDLLANSK